MESTPYNAYPSTSSTTSSSTSTTGHHQHQQGNNNSQLLYTPRSKEWSCRKRKLSVMNKFGKMTLDEAEPSPVLYYSPDAVNENMDQDMFSSTTNDSNHFAHFSCQIPEEVTSIDPIMETPRKRRRNFPSNPAKIIATQSKSAPTTPLKSGYSFSSSKHYEHHNVKTPEVFKILYPQLMKTPVKAKPSPVKKNLFSSDPFQWFCSKSKHEEIMYKVFSYLGDEDLVNLKKVSKLCERVINEHKPSKQRCQSYMDYVQRNKENRSSVCKVQKAFVQNKSLSPPPSPESVSHVRFRKAAENLAPTQCQVKCLKCYHPAVKEGYLCQCINIACGYIYCIRCMSHSYSKEQFIDSCGKSEIVSTPLSDVSNMDYTPSFFLNSLDSTSFSHSFVASNEQLKKSGSLDSSGYHSMVDSSASFTKSKTSPFTEHNTIPKIQRRVTLDVRSVSNVKTKKSPERDKIRSGSVSPKPKMNVIGSKASKKNLRRL